MVLFNQLISVKSHWNIFFIWFKNFDNQNFIDFMWCKKSQDQLVKK